MKRFTYVPVPDWPPLAWLARCPAGGDVVEVYHGPWVETRDDWFCEGVWDGRFRDGDFDHTDVMFGSGCRMRAEDLRFVSSSHAMDRLHSIETAGGVWVSNSLPCLASAVDGSVDTAYGAYTYDFRSIKYGIDDYVPCVPTSSGTIRLTYYRNLRWSGGRLAEVDKPVVRRRLTGFAAYRSFLTGSLEALATNGADEARVHRYSLLSTISSGYDSPAVAVLARPLGLRRTFGFREDRDGVPDDGGPIAERLGLEHVALPRGTWRDDPEAVATFVVADANGSDLDMAAAEPLLRGALLLTGNCGYAAWERHTPAPREYRFGRGDNNSGLPLTEYRLRSGFQHVPVPMLGLHQLDDIQAVASSPEMAAWTLGGPYDRPIPRRIVEEAGVPRGAFGASKKGVSLLLSRPELFWQPWSADYLAWLDGHSGDWLRRGKIPPRPLSRLAGALRPAAGLLARALGTADGARPGTRGMHDNLVRFCSKEYLYLFLFPWALDRAKRRYRADRVIRKARSRLGRPSGRPAVRAAAGRAPGASGAIRQA